MNLLDRARFLRNQMTEAECKFWYLVGNRRLGGYKFKRQFPVGHYILDFACFEARLAIEIDGGQHAGNQKDLARTAWLQQQGWHVMRFWNNEILQNKEGVAHMVLEYLKGQQSPSPDLRSTSPSGRGKSL